MTDTSVAIIPQRPAPAPQADHKHRVTGKIRTAIAAMVWDGLPRAQAAQAAGISEHGLYKALRKPPVRSLYLSELEVLRTSEKARNIHTLADVRDQTDNQMARVQAVKALEQLGDEQHIGRSAQSMAPGFVIQVVNMNPTNAAHLPGQDAVPAKPLIEHTSVSGATENEGE